MTAGTHPYDLPAGKEYHIFIACSGEDSEKGRWLMEQLESRFPFRCVYHERDFLPGAMIVDNMREFMDKSVKCLLLISQASLDSYHVTLERTFAISISNETGRNCIIPVLLEDVPLPPVLRHMTYIDWRPHVQGDVVAKIRDAYCQSAYQIGLSSNLNQFIGDDNGKPIGYIKGYHGSSNCCGCRLKFETSNLNYEDIDQETRGHIEQMCSDTTEALNSYSGMKCYGLFTMRRICIGMLITSLVFGVLVVGIYGIYVVANKEVFNGLIIWIPIMVGMIVVPFCYLVFLGAIGKKLTRKYIEITLWKILMDHYKKSKCLIFYDNLPLGIFQFWTQRTVPQIVVIRYDTNPCKEFVLLYLQTKYKNIPDITIEGYQEWADNLILATIAYYSHDIIHWKDLPNYASNRHGMWKRKECICQLVEEHLSDLKPHQYIWYDSFSKSERKNYSEGRITYWRTIIL